MQDDEKKESGEKAYHESADDGSWEDCSSEFDSLDGSSDEEPNEKAGKPKQKERMYCLPEQIAQIKENVKQAKNLAKAKNAQPISKSKADKAEK